MKILRQGVFAALGAGIFAIIGVLVVCVSAQAGETKTFDTYSGVRVTVTLPDGWSVKPGVGGYMDFACDADPEVKGWFAGDVAEPGETALSATEEFRKKYAADFNRYDKNFNVSFGSVPGVGYYEYYENKKTNKLFNFFAHFIVIYKDLRLHMDVNAPTPERYNRVKSDVQFIRENVRFE